EEAPRHPEVIIATNPAYRQDNLNYWAAAGQMLGVPGFAGGGIFGKILSGASQVGSDILGTAKGIGKTALDVVMSGGDITKLLPSAPHLPAPFDQLGPWVLGKIGSWIKGKVTGLFSGPSGSFPGNVTGWLNTAMAATGVGGPIWMALLQRQVS